MAIPRLPVKAKIPCHPKCEAFTSILEGRRPRATFKPVKLQRPASSHRVQSLLEKDMAAGKPTDQRLTIVNGAGMLHRLEAVEQEEKGGLRQIRGLGISAARCR